MQLADWMARERLTDEAMAERINAAAMAASSPFRVSTHGVSKWRRGERSPRSSALRWIATVTGAEVSANDFVGEEAA